MKKIVLFLLLGTSTSVIGQFNPTAQNWNIPTAGELDWKVFESISRHNVVDFDGDGLPDFIDSENQNTTGTSDVWTSGSQQYWKVYLNNGC